MTITPDNAAPITGRMWAGLVAAALGIFLTALDVTVNVALPNITEDLNTDLETVQWIIIFYVGGTTGMQLGLGGAVDMYGLKRFFVVGLLAYMLAVFLIGVAPGFGYVLGLRVFQAVGNGLMWPSVMSLVSVAAGERFQGAVQGAVGSVGSVASIVGLVVGGMIYGRLEGQVFLLSALLIAAVFVMSFRLAFSARWRDSAS